MKKILYIICAIFALTSCSKEELTTTSGQNPDGTYSFNLGVEEPDYVAKTRTTTTIDRYVMEVYEGDLNATPVKQTNTTGKFIVEMKKDIDYICLFWADDSTTYNVESLKAVKQMDENAQGTAAYFANVSVNSTTFDGDITLKRAVGELSFIDKNGLTETTNKLKITYPYASASFNLGDGTVTHATGTTVRTIADIAAPTKATDAFTADYILAPTVAGKLSGLKLQLNSEQEKIIAETAIKANVKTKITGEYQPKPVLKDPEVGDFYMKDGTWLPGATTLTTAEQADCIGIVYWTGDPTKNDEALKAAHPSCTHGLVVALKENGTSTWQTTESDINAWITTNTTYAAILSGTGATDPINKIMGYNNTKAIEAYNAVSSGNKVGAIDKVVDYRTAVPTPASNSGWFLPSIKELTLLCGLENQDENVYNDNYGTANRKAIDTQLAKINNSNQITNNNYWSSTDYVDNNAWLIRFSRGTITGNSKKLSASVRVVSAF